VKDDRAYRAPPLLELAQGLCAFRYRIGVARTKRVRDVFRDVGRNLNGPDDIAEQVGQSLFTYVAVVALAVVIRAVVVDVFSGFPGRGPSTSECLLICNNLAHSSGSAATDE